MIVYRAMWVVAAMIVLATAAGAGWFIAQTPGTVLSSESEHAIATSTAAGGTVSITVEQGESARAIGHELQDHGVIRSSRLFEVLVALSGVQGKLEAGDYEFDQGTPAIEAVHRIAEGKTASRDVVIPEGRRAEEVAELLQQAGVVDEQAFLDALVKSQYNEPFLAASSSTSLEGFLFPAKYSFTRGAKASDVVDRMLQAFQDKVASQLQLEGQTMTLDQVVTLASIVEREAQDPSERPLIASVFLNRLRLGIALEADPTVQYALTQFPLSVDAYGWWKKELTLDDLKVDSPYNTYVHPGLPPGPIANPGLDSILAVVRPAQTNYLFFVAKNDGTGQHAFAETLEEHLANIQKYQQ
ncbi:MAG: endolytic transglycosylase MltG [Dehalococcoidia bacterium]|nr:MAG: endolytic transglycosylase MltG [Dehalococcoidia bacterium]